MWLYSAILKSFVGREMAPAKTYYAICQADTRFVSFLHSEAAFSTIWSPVKNHRVVILLVFVCFSPVLNLNP